MQIPDVPPQLLSALVEAAAGQRLALVGGVVRDLLLHRHHQDPWRGLPDLDLVVEGSAADLVARLPKALEHQLGQPVPLRQRHHVLYGTVAVELDLPAAFGGNWLLDLASARQEVYPQPAENPRVTPGTLEQDLARRDLTINSMALEFSGTFGTSTTNMNLLDPYGGQQDLVQKQIRFLHKRSICDDPTRIVRAARYGARLGFSLTDEGLDQANETIRKWPWGWRYGNDPLKVPSLLGVRLRSELELLLSMDKWSNALNLLKNWNCLCLIDPGLEEKVELFSRLNWCKFLKISRLQAFVAYSRNPVYTSQRFLLPQRMSRIYQDMISLSAKVDNIEDIMADRLSPAEWSQLIETCRYSSQAAKLLLFINKNSRHELLQWIYRWQTIQSPLNGLEILNQYGCKPSEVGEIKNKLRYSLIEKLYHHS
jgi:poly(A) polymerase